MVIASIKERIVQALSQNNDGMTIQDLSRELNTTRITVSKYVHELLGAETLSEKKVGVYRFLYLSEKKK